MVALNVFNNVELLRNSLSKAGIGSLRAWRSDPAGWICSTPYFEFGEVSELGMPDNIALYLESEAQNYVRIVKLCMNQRNKEHKADSYAFYLRVVDSLFQLLELNVPEGINASMQLQENFSYENERYSITTSMTPDPRTDYYKLTITAK
ncbi:hypothetical protein [Spirosoma litoris]